MSNRMPSLLALLGLAAAAGYQNRDALRDMLGGLQQGRGPLADGPVTGPVTGAHPAGSQSGPQTGWLDQIIDRARQSLDNGNLLGAGLGELVERFSNSGQAEAAESWVGSGQNRNVTPAEIRSAVGADVIADLCRQSGLTEVELLARLAQTLPELVDRATPDGQLPAQGPATYDPVRPY